MPCGIAVCEDEGGSEGVRLLGLARLLLVVTALGLGLESAGVNDGWRQPHRASALKRIVGAIAVPSAVPAAVRQRQRHNQKFLGVGRQDDLEALAGGAAWETAYLSL